MNQKRQIGEAVVMTKQDSHALRYVPVRPGSLSLYERETGAEGERVRGRLFREGRDYVVDWGEGRLRRTADSRIPDWARHRFFGKGAFDQTGLNDYGNESFTVYADYDYDAGAAGGNEAAEEASATAASLLPGCDERHRMGLPITYVVYGDSISTGAEASHHRHSYSYRLYEQLKTLFPASEIRYEMRAIGGETSMDGWKRLQRDVIPLKPHLITIAYGMNDANRLRGHVNEVPVSRFQSYIGEMIASLKERTEADIILVTPCEPNPMWKFCSGEIHHYAEAMKETGMQYGVPVADVHTLWLEELGAGKTPESLLLNNINHPNDYGHDIYTRALSRLLGMESGMRKEGES
ncbi:SGNH/GDSL hydrolase family protein [Paenibacillus sp. J5C_2022]|uniref:SGNH/GDSL hydrolase family protein n=1 Tax=Paenibacillus sp. J5C2022 TaxID=2977129 RepID=UPI0021D1E832|nr:SGNH/GDSL hydrolase family protein [Paenibacillus sp. J5C2022]MCU6710745.1 SGNH/GDSL hydrolase family protein [Paenibacillus sp. J5C2022]